MLLSEKIRDIRQARENNKLVVFVGAGVSANSNIPTWGILVKEFAKELNYFEDNTNDESKGIIKREANLTQDEFLKIPQYYYDSDESHDHKNYKEIIQRTLSSDSPSNAINDIIFKLLPHHIITTNYDKLLEKSNDPNVRLYSVISEDKHLLAQNNNRYIIKMHGDIDSLDNIVLKESDYIEYSQTHILIETYIKSLLVDHTFLFIGYSLNDYNLKLIMGWINYLAKKHEANHNRPNNYIIQIQDGEIKAYEKLYFEMSNIYILDSKNLPEAILQKNKGVELTEIGKKVYSYLDYILDEKSDYLVDPLENILFDKYQIFTGYNRISYEDLRAIHKFNNSVLKRDILYFYQEEDYRSLESILKSESPKADFIRSVIIRTGINLVQFADEHFPVESMLINVDEDKLFDLYIENRYVDLLLRLDNIKNRIAKAYYYNLVFPYGNNGECQDEMFNALHDLKESDSIFDLIVFKMNSLFLKQRNFSEFEIERKEIESIFDNLPMKVSKSLTYLKKIYYGMESNLYKANEMLKKHENTYLRSRNRLVYGQDFGEIFDLQAIVYDYYFYLKGNFLMLDHFSDPKTLIEPYLKAVICTYAPENYLNSDIFGQRKNEQKQYPLNSVDLDMFVKYTNPKQLEKWFSEYKVKSIIVDEHVEIINKFENFCVSMKIYANVEMLTQLNSFLIIITKLELSNDEVKRVLLGINMSMKKIGKMNATMDNDFFKLLAIFLKKNTGKADNAYKDLLASFIAEEVVETIEVNDFYGYKNIITQLSIYADQSILKKIEDFIEKSTTDKIKKKRVYLFHKFLKQEKWRDYILENLREFSNEEIFWLIIDDNIPYSDLILTKFLEVIEKEKDKRVKAPGIYSYPDHLQDTLNYCVLLKLFDVPIPVEKFVPYIEYSEPLSFLVNPDEFDYSKIDTSDYMWVNFFRNKDFADKLIEHREDIISKELLLNCANDVLTTDQMKILYGMLLDKSELWNIEGLFKD